MKINKTQLRKVIRESINNVLKESDTLSYDQELQPGWYVCIEGNYGDVSVWVTDDLNEVREVLDSSESNIMGPYNTEMEANEIANQETEKYGETNGFYRSGNKLTESQLTKIIQKSVKKILKENEDFTPHGYKGTSNWGGYEMQISNNGDEARIRDSHTGEVSDWLEIQFDEEGVAYVIDANGQEERLCDYMRY